MPEEALAQGHAAPGAGAAPCAGRARGLAWWAGTVALAAAVVALAIWGHSRAGSLGLGAVAPASHGATVSVPLAAVHMVSAEVGWASGQQGQVLRTTNGGVSWHDVTPLALGQGAGATLDALAVLDANDARVARVRGGGMSVYGTSDGGAHWTALATVTAPHLSTGQVELSFVNPQTGWLLETSAPALGQMRTALFATRDGGRRWSELGASSLPQGGMYATGLAFAGTSRGWLTGTYHGGGTPLYTSTDGGGSWRRQTLPLPAGVAYLDTYAPRLFGQDGILPAITGGGTQGPEMIFYRTTNGGRIWTPGAAVPVAAQGPRGPAWSFADPKDGFASDGSLLQRTTNAGGSWTTVDSNVHLGVASGLDFLTTEEGWAVVGGNLLRTTDGGRTWTPLSQTASRGTPAPLGSTSSASGGSGTGAAGALSLASIRMVSAQVGWATEALGQVLRTMDGGSTWLDVTPAAPAPTGKGGCATAFQSAQDAWLACPDGTPAAGSVWKLTVWRTTDGGANWSAAVVPTVFTAADTTGSMEALSLGTSDGVHGWLMAQPGHTMNTEPGELLGTGDGGKTWSLLAETGSSGSLPFGGSVAFQGALDGWLAGGKVSTVPDQLYRTLDGGRTWRAVSLPMPSGRQETQAVVTTPTFFSATQGLLPVWFQGRASVYLYRTQDGGRTWSHTTPARGSLFSVAGLDEVYVLDGEDVFHTQDGGLDWQGFPGGGLGVLEAQQDGQENALDVLPGGSGWLLATAHTCACLAKQPQWAASATPVLMRTTDGGRTWTQLHPVLRSH